MRANRICSGVEYNIDHLVRVSVYPINELWNRDIVKCCGSGLASGSLSSRDECFLAIIPLCCLPVREPPSLTDLTHQMRGVDLPPPLLRTLDQLERHGQSCPA